MRMFSIREIEQLTEIKTHTVRIWEQRYGFLVPARDGSNLRTYSLPQLEQLMDIAVLLRNGYRISFLASLDQQALKERLQRLQLTEDKMEQTVNALLISMYRIDANSFETLMRETSEQIEPIALVQSIIVPFLERTSLFWSGRRLTEEHFVVTCMRKYLIRAIAHLPLPADGAASALLFLQDVRQLDLALLVAQFRLQSAGMRVLYMGTDVSHDNLVNAWEKFRPDFFFTYLSNKQLKALHQLERFQRQHLQDATIIVSIYPGTESRELAPGLSMMPYNDALDCMLGRIKQSPATQPDNASLRAMA